LLDAAPVAPPVRALVHAALGGQVSTLLPNTAIAPFSLVWKRNANGSIVVAVLGAEVTTTNADETNVTVISATASEELSLADATPVRARVPAQWRSASIVVSPPLWCATLFRNPSLHPNGRQRVRAPAPHAGTILHTSRRLA
jgi:hypothetical protein